MSKYTCIYCTMLQVRGYHGAANTVQQSMGKNAIQSI